MNLSEALDAALPEIPKAKLTRVRPPCLDPELIVREDSIDGEPMVGAFQRSQGNYFRFSPAQWQLASLFDGIRSYEEIAARFEEQSGASLSAADVRLFAQNMDEADFWYQTPQERNIALNEKLRAQRNRRAKRKSKLNVAHISFSAWDPDRYFNQLDALLGNIIYSRWSVLAAVLLFAFESTVFVSHWHVIGPDIPLFYNFAKKSIGDLAQFWLLFLVIGFFHETAHGLTCKHYGGEVHRMGLMLIYLTPAFFVDITETWISATKVQRLAAIIAGIWVEMIFCGFAMIAWINTLPGQWLHDFSYEVILITGIAVVVVNLNPLIKLDGYYFLTELIGIPDLKERSTAFLSGWFQKRVLRLPVDVPVVARRRAPFFMLYAFVSAAYSYMLLFVVVRFTFNVFYNWMTEFALLPAGALAFAVFRSRIQSLGGVLKRFAQAHSLTRVRRPVPVALIALSLLLILAPVFRVRESALFVIEPQQSLTLHAPAEARVTKVLVQEGQEVSAGEPLLELSSPNVESLQAGARSQLQAAQYSAFNAELNRRSIGAAAASQQAASRAGAIAASAAARLVVRAPQSGQVLTEDPDALLDQAEGPGQPLLVLAAEGPRVARIFVPAAALDRIPPHAAVTLVLPDRFSVVRLRLTALDGLPAVLPGGLLPSQEYKGLAPPTYYSARIPLSGVAASLPLGLTGKAQLYGPRRSLFERAVTVGSNLVHAHVW